MAETETDTTARTKLAALIRERRIAKAMSFTELAALVGVNHNTPPLWEANTIPRDHQIAALARALGIARRRLVKMVDAARNDKEAN